MMGKRWSEAEVRAAEALAAAGWSRAGIGRKIRRSRGAVAGLLFRQGAALSEKGEQAR